MISFHREILVNILFSDALSDRRGFLFKVSAGFTNSEGHIDADSGMLVSLPEVDTWLFDLRIKLEERPFKVKRWKTEDGYFELLKQVRMYLEEKAQEKNAVLTNLAFQEQRGWGFYWNKDQEDKCLHFITSQYVEILDSQLGARLCKLELHWARVSDCGADLPTETVSVLRKVSGKSYADFINQVSKIPGMELSTGTTLKKIKIVNFRDNEVLEFC